MWRNQRRLGGLDHQPTTVDRGHLVGGPEVSGAGHRPLRRILTDRMLLPMAQRVGGSRPELRASFVASQLVGLTVVRYVVGIQPLADASRDDLIRALEPVFDHYLRGDWV